MKAQPAILHPADWGGIRFIVFDIDGTLYDQRALRVCMAREMLMDAVRERDVGVFLIVKAYRRIRERLARAEACYSETILVDRTADATGFSPAVVRATVAEWIEQRPLAHLADRRYPGLLDLFAGMRRMGILAGALSDYPAQAKLAALGLTADYVVTAGDDGVGFFKPNTRGLERLVAAARVPVHATVVIGDRADRDGLVAQRLGMRALIRSSRPMANWQTFSGYDAPLFAPLLATAQRSSAS